MAVSGKQSFVLYHDIRQPLELLTDAERGQLFLALLDYSERGIVPDFTGAQQMAFMFIKTALDRDTAAWEDKREKRREAGSLGGKQAAANRADATFAEQNQQNAANQAVPVPAPVPAPVPVPNNYKADKPQRAPRFTPPSQEEVAAYCVERGNGIDPAAFVDFYAQQGWRLSNGNPVKDWKAAIRTWEKRERAQQKKGEWSFDDFRSNA